MASGVYSWSQTAASNGTADSTINFAEGMAPSAVNDSARALMASVAKWRDDISGSLVTGGTATAYTITSNSGFDTLAHLNGQIVAFVPNATNTNTVGNDVTLNVDSLGAKPIRMQPGLVLPNGSLILGTPYCVSYNNSDGVFYLEGMTNPYAVPLGGMLDYVGSSTPSSSYVFPSGQAISRTTYATLFSLISTTYGTGDGSTTFNVPDLTGRVVAMKEASATRLTATYFGGNSASLGAVGGSESHTLTTAEIPSHTHANTLTDPSHVHPGIPNPSGAGGGGGLSTINGTTNSGAAVTGITINNAAQGGGGAHAIVQPTLILNKILRVI